MNYRNLFTFLSVGLLSTFLLADNPEKDPAIEEAEVVEASESSVEQVVEEETSSEEIIENEEGAVVLEKVVVTGSKIKKGPS